jgi:hypothetical protein
VNKSKKEEKERETKFEKPILKSTTIRFNCISLPSNALLNHHKPWRMTSGFNQPNREQKPGDQCVFSNVPAVVLKVSIGSYFKSKTQKTPEM